MPSGSSEVNDVNCEMLTNLDLMDIDLLIYRKDWENG